MSPPLRLCLLGSFTVVGAVAVTTPTGKARRVLAVLAQRRGEFVTIDALVDALWEDRPPPRADRNIAALISRLRGALGRELIEGSAAGYRMPTDAAAVDLHEAADLVATAEFEFGHGRFALSSTSAEMAAKLLDADVAMAGEREDRWVAGAADVRQHPSAPRAHGVECGVRWSWRRSTPRCRSPVRHCRSTRSTRTPAAR